MLPLRTCAKFCCLVKGQANTLLVSLKCFLTLSKWQNFWLFQTERFCRQQFKIRWKWWKVLRAGRKHFWKRRNCFLWNFHSIKSDFSFSHNVFREFYHRHENKGLFGKGLMLNQTSKFRLAQIQGICSQQTTGKWSWNSEIFLWKD